jgi:hypothetical protein
MAIAIYIWQSVHMEPLDVRGVAARLGLSCARVNQLLREEWFVQTMGAFRVQVGGRWRFPAERLSEAISELHSRSLAELRAEESP